MNPKFTLNIFHKVLITLLAVTLIPLCTLWLVNDKAAQRQLTANVSQNLVLTMDTVANGINGWDNTNVRAMTQASSLDDMISMKAERQNPILSVTGTAYEWSYLMFTVTPDGANVGRNDGGALTPYGDRSYFQQVIKGAPVGRQVVIGKTSGKPALILATPIRDAGSTLVGVLAMSMYLTDISKIVTDIRIGETGRAILLDASNKVIAHGDASKVRTALQDFSAYPALKVAGIADAPVVYTSEERQVIGFMRKLPQGWTLLVEQDYDEAFATMNRMEKDARILIGVSVALVIAIAIFLGKALTRPINDLTAIARQLSNGELQVTIAQIDRGDEIGSLARAIDRLGVSIQLAMDRLRKKG
ncbi:cache domain-containing protein [Massilia scottii]|uniref:cache domain-containing protein n=1 Tax=Massilia scottii TaxID=3057166 RepID=UPI00279682EF|nr:cache and HAMP domain-containing protein [Massilia sp. CCM 9029]MDQ1834801.1 cache and HAMP domain-containing protein [Massilia sp. CCM 9029]